MTGPRRGTRLPGIGLALAGLLVGVEATTFDVAFLTDPVGPKALPWLVAAMMVVAGAHAALRPPPSAAWPAPAALARIAAATAVFLLYAGAIDLVGFFVSTTLVVGLLAWLYGAPTRAGFVAALGLSGALWLLFVQLLSLPLPIGRLWMR